MKGLHWTTGDMGVQQRVIRWMMITTVVALVIYLAFVFIANASEVMDAVSRLNGWWLLAILIMSLMSYGVRALRWNYYLIRLGIKMNHRLMLLLYFAGLSMLITPAMISGVVKVGLVKVREGVELSRTLPIVVVERLTDLIAMVALAMFGILFFKIGYVSIVGTVIFVVVTIGIIRVPALRNTVLGFFGLIPGLKHHIEAVKKLLDSAQTLLDGEALLMGSFFGFISWGIAGLAMYTLIEGFGLDLSLPETLFIMAFPGILGIMSQLPGGIGLEEGTMVSLLLRKDVELPEATALVLFFRLVTLWFGLGVGMVALSVFTHEIGSESVGENGESGDMRGNENGDTFENGNGNPGTLTQWKGGD